MHRYDAYERVRAHIAAAQVAMPAVLKTIASRALQVHGSLVMSDEMPFMHMIVNGYHVGIADGPTEVHKTTLARGLLSRAEPAPGLFPTYHRPLLKDQALKKYADVLARHGRS